MGKRGPQPKGRVKLQWSIEFAYAIGLLTADGCLSKDGRHIDLTSKDEAQILLFRKCLGLATKVSRKNSGAKNMAYHTQFGDVLFYRFLESIGLTPAKSKTISSVKIPRKYFIDFIRGYFDGDGSSYSYYDPIYKNSFRFYISFTSASPAFFDWLRVELENTMGIRGYLSYNRNNPYTQLKFSKGEALILARHMYHSAHVPCLERKRIKIMKSIRTIALLDGK